MVKITFKDGVSVKLHEDGSIDFLEGSNVDTNYNFHMAMAMCETDLVNNEEHIDMLYYIIDKRLGGILSP